MIVVHGVGPIYWGVEREDDVEIRLMAREERRITRSWMVEDQAPWRKSIAAFRVRIGRYGVHLGLCKRLAPDSDERPWFPKFTPVSEISKWNRLHDDEGAEVQDRGQEVPDPAPEQVRHPDGSGPVHSGRAGAGQLDTGPRPIP